MSTVLIYLIRAYQVVISPHFGNCCRFYPSCSNYCIIAVERYGFIKGFWLGLLRVCRCNPFNYGGVDLVPEPRAFMVHGKHQNTCGCNIERR